MSETKEEINIIALIEAGTHYAEAHGDKTHVINCRTGETFIMYSAMSPKIPSTLELVILEDGTKVWTQESLVPSTKSIRTIEYNPVLVDLMCQRILEGKGISEICGTENFPSYTTFCRWRREHSWIDEALEKARKDRGERYRDEALATAKAAVSTKDPLGASHLKVETLKWAAAIDQPERFSPRAKFEANISVPTQINVITGIDRTPVDVPPKKEES